MSLRKTGPCYFRLVAKVILGYTKMVDGQEWKTPNCNDK